PPRRLLQESHPATLHPWTHRHLGDRPGGKGRTVSVNLDQPLAKQYHQALRTLKKSLKLSGSIDLALMAGLRDVVSISDQPTEDPKLAKTVQQLTTKALTDLEDMRTREGKALAEDM